MNSHSADLEGAVMVKTTKKYNDLYEKIIDFKNLQYAYKQVIKGERKFKKDAILFSMVEDTNLVRLWHELRTGQYRMGNYIRFKVYEPKERMVSAPRVKDKIVQFAIHNVIKEVYKNVFISDSYACLERKRHA